MITENDLRSAFVGTCLEHNGATLEQSLKGLAYTNKICAVYELLFSMNTRGINTSVEVIIIHSDGGIQMFDTYYTFGTYKVFMFRYANPWYGQGHSCPFGDTVEDMVRYFNNWEIQFLATCRSIL